MKIRQISFILLAVGLLLFGIWLVLWAVDLVQASGSPDANRSLWQYSAPFLVAVGFLAGSVALLVGCVRLGRGE